MRMENCHEAIKSAEKLTEKLQKIEEIFKSDNIEEITSEIVEIKQNLEKLPGEFKEFEELKNKLFKLQNKLEQITKVQIKKAFVEHNIPSLQYFIRIFSLIDREDELKQLFFNHFLMEILSIWNSTIYPPSSPQPAFVTSLPIFYNHFVDLVEKDVCLFFYLPFFTFLPPFFSFSFLLLRFVSPPSSFLLFLPPYCIPPFPPFPFLPLSCPLSHITAMGNSLVSPQSVSLVLPAPEHSSPS